MTFYSINLKYKYILYNGGYMYENKFSIKNSLLYKMKCINTINKEYESLEKEDYDRIEKYTDKR